MEPHVEKEIEAIADICSRLYIRKGWLVDAGAADGLFWSNTIDLVRSGWKGILIEADLGKFKELVANTALYPEVRPVHRKISLERHDRLDDILTNLHVPIDFELLQIDIDGNDYWIWESLLSFRPKIVSIEHNSNFEPHERKAIAYEPEFSWTGDTYYGASAGAMVLLGTKKGYTLVRHVSKSNLFFVRNDLASGLKPLDVATVEKKPIHRPTERTFVDV